MRRHTIFVFANLKPSQVIYKLYPLSQSSYVDRIIFLRRKYFETRIEKLECYSMPGLFRINPFYWIFFPLFGIYLIIKHKATIILNYNILPHGFNAYFASKITKRPVIFGEICEDTLRYHSNMWMRPFIHRILLNTLYIAVPGVKLKKHWESQGFSNLVVLHSTINTDIFIPVSVKSKEYDFIYIGEFDKNKRADLILLALTRLHQKGIRSRMCIIGYGSEEEKLQNICNQYSMGPYVSIIKTNETLPYIQKSRILVMASLSEGLPCVMLEAMSCELSVIVPPVGEIQDVIEDEKNGYIFNNTIEQLVEKMEMVIVAYDKGKIIRSAARQTIVNEHSYGVAIKKWNSLLAKIPIK